MPTTVIKTVKQSGGDYSSIQSFINSYAKDLVSADEAVICEIYKRDDGNPWDENISVSGGSWVVDSTRNITFRAPQGQRHYGIAGAGVVIEPSATGHVWEVDIDYCQFEWLEMTGWSGSSKEAFRVRGDGVKISHCLIHDNVSTDGQGDGVYAGADGIEITVENCFFWNLERCAILASTVDNVTYNVRNVTAYNVCNNSFFAGSAHRDFPAIGPHTNTAFPMSNVIFNMENCYAHTGTYSGGENDVFQEGNGGTYATIDNNISSDDTADDFGGSSNLVNKSAGNQFQSISSGSEDLHLKSGSDCIGAAKDLGSTAAIDIDGADRDDAGVVWDVGADQFNLERTTNDFMPFFTGLL